MRELGPLSRSDDTTSFVYSTRVLEAWNGNWRRGIDIVVELRISRIKDLFGASLGVSTVGRFRSS